MDVAVRVSDRAVEAVVLIGMSQGSIDRQGVSPSSSIPDGCARVGEYSPGCKVQLYWLINILLCQ